MARAHLLIGPVGAGKTTFATALTDERKAVRFSIDDWMIRLYGHHMPRDVFHARIAACLDIIYETSSRLLELGTDVVLDCGYWRREHREGAREGLRGSGAELCLYYFDVPAPERWSRLERRNAALPPGTFEITREMFDAFELCFEPPAHPEVFVRVGAERPK